MGCGSVSVADGCDESVRYSIKCAPSGETGGCHDIEGLRVLKILRRLILAEAVVNTILGLVAERSGAAGSSRGSRVVTFSEARLVQQTIETTPPPPPVRAARLRARPGVFKSFYLCFQYLIARD